MVGDKLENPLAVEDGFFNVQGRSINGIWKIGSITLTSLPKDSAKDTLRFILKLHVGQIVWGAGSCIWGENNFSGLKLKIVEIVFPQNRADFIFVLHESENANFSFHVCPEDIVMNDPIHAIEFLEKVRKK